MPLEERPQALRRRAALSTMRSVLVALLLVALFGSFAAVMSYRADVDEALLQIRDRVARQGQLHAKALNLHFDLIRVELQRLAERGHDALVAHNEAMMSDIRGDAALFKGGVVFLDLQGHPIWSEPPMDLGPDITVQPWFQTVLAKERPAIDELLNDESSRLAVALPVRRAGALSGILVGIAGGSDRLLLEGHGASEQMLLLSSRRRVVLPLQEPAWTHAADFAARVEALYTASPETETTWTVAGETVMAEVFAIPNTELQVLAIESEEATLSPIRRRLKGQLVFLLMVQLVALGAFLLFLRRIWRTFLEAELHFANQEKMAALGSASSLIAHEVRNSLNSLKAAAALLSSGGDVALVSRTVNGQVERLGHLARSLLSFSKPPELRRVPVQLDALVSEIVGALTSLPEWPEAHVTTQFDSGVVVESDPLLLSTAIDNLVRNAVEAVVAAKDLGRVEPPQVTVGVHRLGHEAEVTVDDNAGEAPAELEARLGEPFYTTKPKGIGLGLSMTLKAVEQLGGTLRFHRTAVGSRFVIRIPLGP